MNAPTHTTGATTTWIRITVSGIPVLTTTGIIPGGDMAAIILPGILAVTMVVAATMAVAVTTLAESDLKPDGGELLTPDAVPDPGTGGGPDWKGIRRAINPADESLIDEVGETEAVWEAEEMRDTEEVGNTGLKDLQGYAEIQALRPRGVRSDEVQEEAQDEAHDEE